MTDTSRRYKYLHDDADAEARLALSPGGLKVLLLADPGVSHDALPLDAGYPVMLALIDAPVVEGDARLAYEWTEEPKSLADLLEGGPMPVLDALRCTLRLLDGICNTRLIGLSMGVFSAHCVLLGDDFKDTRLAAALPGDMPGCDVILQTGRLLYEMLTGIPPVRSPEGELLLPSLINGDVSVELEQLVLSALGEPGTPAFDGPLDVRRQVADFLTELETSLGIGEDLGPAGKLLRRMSDSDDFPALSRAIGAINRINDVDKERLQSLSAVVLRDFSLTNKVLRLANSADYVHFGPVSTVSRAVTLLGFATIKALSLSLMLMEHLQNREQVVDLRDEVARAFFASLISRKLAERCRYHEIEEARIGGMCHMLGRLLAHYYFQDTVALIAADVMRGESEAVAARRHLGVSFDELGLKVGKSWHLPPKLLASMMLEEERPRPPKHDEEWLRLFANAARALMDASLQPDDAQRARAMAQASHQYGGALQINDRDLRALVNEAIRECLIQAPIFGVDAMNDGVLAAMRALAGLPPLGPPLKPAAPAAKASDAAASAKPAERADAAAMPRARADGAPDARHVDNPFMKIASKDRPEVLATLASCSQEVSETLVGEFQLNELLQMILETVYRSLGTDRILLATLSNQRQALVGRVGFGEGISSFVHAFAVPLGESNDIFRLSLARNADVLIEDTGQRAIRDLIPAWYRALSPGSTFLILPLVMNKTVVGMIYADKSAPGSLIIGPRELSFLKILRNQALLAIRQKSTSL